MRKIFQTAPNLPSEIICRTFKIPSSKEWLGIFNAAYVEMVNVYNWEQVHDSDLTVEESIEVIKALWDEYWDTLECTEDGACLQPSGNRVLRLGLGGHFEQLSNGAWIPPTDDYTVPAVPSRAEPTAAERKCAAAANAANVLQTVYEIASDAVAADLDAAATIALMVAYFASAIGFWLGLAAEAIIWLTYALFIAFLEIAEFMTADLWDADFTTLLKCVLEECATDDGDVVTFDFTCVNDALAGAVELTGIDALTQLRLFGQVSFLLGVIGVDGLNAAGATTAITDANCDDCFELVELENVFGTAEHLGGNLWRVTSGLQTIGGVSTQASRVRRVDLECNFQIISITPVGTGFARPNFWYDCSIGFNSSPPIGNCLLEWNPDNYPTAGGSAIVVDIQVASC